jgi:MoxR-like ATPase
MLNTAEIANYFRASIPLIAVDSPSSDEGTVLSLICEEVGQPLSLPVARWDMVAGFQACTFSRANGVALSDIDGYTVKSDPIADAISWIANYDRPGIFVMCDLQHYIGTDPQRLDYGLVRQIKNLVQTLKQSKKRVILLGQGISLATDLQGIIQTVRNELPISEAIADTIDNSIRDLCANYRPGGKKLTANVTDMERLIRVSQGLTLVELMDVLRLSAVVYSALDDRMTERINSYKIAKLKRLNCDFAEAPDVEVGGLANLKVWLKRRIRMFSSASISKGLPTPKGVMLVGLPGVGKSLIAKTIGKIFGMPVLSVDIGSIYNSLVGESERNLRELLATAEAIAPCVLFVDEIEKSLSGVSNANDSGVSQRLFGKLLTWMSDHKAPVFVVATANNIQGLPPEFTRKGRFDEIFFCDAPNDEEREEILNIQLARFTKNRIDLTEVVAATHDFVGAELAALVQEAVLIAEDEDRFPNILPSDLIQVANQTVPLIARQKDQIAHLREWARSNARAASATITVEAIAVTEQAGKIQMLE